MKRRVLVIGGSDQGRQVIDVLEAAGEHVVAGIVDRALPIGSEVVGHVVVGSDTDLATCAATTDADGFVVAIGDNHVRATTFARSRDACPALEPVSAIHPNAVVARDAAIGAGSILMAGAVVSNGCTVGRGRCSARTPRSTTTADSMTSRASPRARRRAATYGSARARPSGSAPRSSTR